MQETCQAQDAVSWPGKSSGVTGQVSLGVHEGDAYACLDTSIAKTSITDHVGLRNSGQE